MPGRWRHALAGAVAAAVALGVTELVAGALPGTPSLLRSVAGVVIDSAPMALVRAAIATLGTRDKPALLAGVVVLSLLLGSGLAVAARRRRWLAVAGLAAFASIGVWAAARPPGAGPWRPAVAGAAGKEGPMKTMARIDTPTRNRAPRAGRVPVAGVAWAPHTGVSKVEVQVDGGQWVKARLGPGGLDTWRQWVLDWDASPGAHMLRARATDGGGRLQTSATALSYPSGATGWHTVRVTVAAPD